MSETPPDIFDERLVATRLQRAVARGAEDFLLKHAAADLDLRLQPIRRAFRDILDLGTPGGAFGQAARDLLTREGGQARLVSAPGLPLDPALGSQDFDLIVSGLTLQQVNDLPGVFAQARRLLRPDGLFLVCLLGGDSLHELRQTLAIAESEIMGGVSPRVAPFADIRALGALLQRAGLALPVADSETLTLRYPHLFALMADLRAMGGGNALHARLRRPSPRRLFARAAEIYADRFADADGRIRATLELVWLSGWAPHASQQQPLKPGSAKARLADALKALEMPLKANDEAE